MLGIKQLIIGDSDRRTGHGGGRDMGEEGGKNSKHKLLNGKGKELLNFLEEVGSFILIVKLGEEKSRENRNKKEVTVKRASTGY